MIIVSITFLGNGNACHLQNLHNFKMPRAQSSYNLMSLCEKVKYSEDFFFEGSWNFAKKKSTCAKCLLELSDTFQTPGTSYRYFHCTNCRTKVSIRNQTILSDAHIGIRFFILLAYTFVPGTIAQKIHEVNSKFILSFS